MLPVDQVLHHRLEIFMFQLVSSFEWCEALNGESAFIYNCLFELNLFVLKSS